MKPKASVGAKLRCWLSRAFLIAASVYLLACAGCTVLQRRLIYFPPVLSADTTAKIGAAEGLERWFGPEGKPIGWKRLAPKQPAEGRILVTHGNAGCAVQCGHYADVIQRAADFDVFIVEYPGYADLSGSPTEQSLYESASEAMRDLSVRGPVCLVGESLGTGVAAYLAGKYPDKVAGLVLLAPYPKLADVAHAHLPWLPVSLLLRERFPAETWLKNYHGPVAFLVAGKDGVIPEKIGRRFYERYASPKRLWEFPQGDHGTLMTQPAETWTQIIDFWQENSQNWPHLQKDR